MNEDTPTLEQWQRLYAAAAEVKALAPWQWMHEGDLFAVEDPASGRIGFVSIMGAVGEHFAVAVYLGGEGLRGFIAIGNARNRVRNRIVNLFIIIMCLFGNLKTFAPMGDADKTASGIFSKTTKRISPLIIFTEVHGHKYSSFYLFDELFCPFHVIFSHSPIHRE